MSDSERDLLPILERHRSLLSPPGGSFGPMAPEFQNYPFLPNPLQRAVQYGGNSPPCATGR